MVLKGTPEKGPSKNRFRENTKIYIKTEKSKILFEFMIYSAAV
jgi:uncharacterized pyridoxamine 5'-phosphate oxidase family protein